jgi:2,3,4,5-tetrahydropyridine-2-carboxylate N-succinyltransferase
VAVNEWVKKEGDVLPYSKNGNGRSWYFEYHDKMLLKRDYAEKGVRVVPATVGAYISKA